MTQDQYSKPHIGHLNETSLHADVEKWYALPGDICETKLDGYVIDILRGETVIEIQTRSFNSIKRKIGRLMDNHPVRLVYPLPIQKWIVKVDPLSSRIISRRKSPKQGRIEDIFYELVWLINLVPHPNFSLDVLFINEEEIRQNDGLGSWRRGGWSITDRKLDKVISAVSFLSYHDYHNLLPPGLQEPFTTKELAGFLKISRRLASKMSYCLKQMGIIDPTGKRGRAIEYRKIMPGEKPSCP